MNVTRPYMRFSSTIWPLSQRATVQKSTSNDLPVGGDLLAVGPLHRPAHGACEVGDRAGPVPGGKEDPVGSVVEVLVRKGLPELDRLLRVVLDPVGRRLSGPAHDHVRLVTLPEDLDVLGIPSVVERLHQLHVAFLNSHLLRLCNLSGKKTLAWDNTTNYRCSKLLRLASTLGELPAAASSPVGQNCPSSRPPCPPRRSGRCRS